MDFDDHLSDLLKRSVATLELPTENVIANGIRAGESAVQRRRVAAGLSALALVGLIAGVAGVAATSLSDHGRGQTTSLPGSALHTTSAATGLITPQVLATYAQRLLPGEGTFGQFTGRSLLGWIGTEFVYDDGQGAAEVDVDLQFPPSGGTLDCTIGECTTVADGSIVEVQKGYEYPGHPDQGARLWTVSGQRTDGVVVSVSESNAPHAKGAVASRALPPFTSAQLQAVVLDGLWQTQVTQSDIDADAGLFTPDAVESQTPQSSQPLTPKQITCLKALKSIGPEAGKQCKIAKRS